jgi:cardiolipin synthase
MLSDLLPATWILVLVDVLVAGPTILHAVLYKRHVRSAIGWTVAIAALPLAGSLFYALFGVNRVRTRSRKLRDERGGGRHGYHGAGVEVAPVPEACSHEALAHVPPALVRIGRSVTLFPLSEGNSVHMLAHGDEAYPSMLDSIDNAVSSVWLLTYIFELDAIGERFVDALQRARARGVDVRVLIDGVGHFTHGRGVGRRLRSLDVPVRYYNPPRLLPPQLYINLRNHRKILLCDRHTLYTGGMNLSARHCLSPDVPTNRARVQDLHFLCRGPIVSPFEELFARDWAWAGGEPAERLPPLAPAAAGSSLCRMIPDGPDHDINKLELVITSTIASAEHRVVLVTPYFLPPDSILTALVTAAVRGVDVTVVVPAVSDHPLLQRAMYRGLDWPLRNRVRVVEQPAPFAHAKLLLVDDMYVLLGSANIDSRSLRLNMEVGLEVFDRALVQRLDEHLAPALAASRPITRERLRRRSLLQRTGDAFVWLFSPYL